MEIDYCSVFFYLLLIVNACLWSFILGLHRGHKYRVREEDGLLRQKQREIQQLMMQRSLQNQEAYICSPAAKNSEPPRTLADEILKDDCGVWGTQAWKAVFCC